MWGDHGFLDLIPRPDRNGTQAVPVDDSLVLLEPEYPGSGVAQLWPRSDTANLHEAKPHLQQARVGLGMLVKASCKSQWVCKLPPPHSCVLE